MKFWLLLLFFVRLERGSDLLYMYVYRVYSLEDVGQIWIMVLMWLDMGLKGASITGL